MYNGKNLQHSSFQGDILEEPVGFKSHVPRQVGGKKLAKGGDLTPTTLFTEDSDNLTPYRSVSILRHIYDVVVVNKFPKPFLIADVIQLRWI